MNKKYYSDLNTINSKKKIFDINLSIFSELKHFVDRQDISEEQKQLEVEMFLREQYRVYFEDKQNTDHINTNLHNMSPRVRRLIFEFRDRFIKY